MKNKALSFYAGVFLIAGLVMSLQIVQSRIFSVTSWYHLSFLVISMAMFGLTLGALKVYRSDETEQRTKYGLLARKHSLAFAIFILVGLLVQLFIPIISTSTLRTIGSLPIVALATSAAYYHAGVVITIALTRAPFPVGKTYGIDLLGAGLGCVVALGLMESIDAPTAILVLSAIAFWAAALFPVSDEDSSASCKIGHYTYHLKKTSRIGAAICLAVAGVNLVSPSPFLYPLWVKNQVTPMSSIDYEEWNSISRVTVMNEIENSGPFLWGPSPKTPKTPVTGKMLIIDGDAGTPITKFDGDFSKHEYLEYDVTNIAYSLPNLRSSAIIGVGGGRDLLSAKYFGVEKVTALDVNPVQIKLLKDHPEYKKYSNLSTLPGVHIINEEARSWFRQNEEKLDLIQMSLIDTWAATGAGAFALSENGLYTTEAWTIFMNDLSDHGVFTLSRWSASAMDDTGRSLSVAMAALFNQGVKNAREHIVLVNSATIATLIVSKSPFTQEQLAAIEKTSIEKEFDIILMPGKPAPNTVLGELLNAQNIEELHAISNEQFFDVSPSTDMRPFFFNQARLTKPIEVAKMALLPLTESHYVSHGQAKATFNLFLIIIFSVVMVALVIIVPLLKTVENKTSKLVLAGTLYFMLIGLGFMFIEISLLQALGVFLGHPIYGLSVVLFSLIISAGIGSLISEKLPLNSLPRQLIWCALTCGYGVVMAFNLQGIFYDYAEAEIITRVLISIAIMCPAGLLMGFGFPTGLTITEQYDTRATSWFWGINGAAGVLGSSIAIALNIAFGIDNTLIVGGICYALLAISFIALRKA